MGGIKLNQEQFILFDQDDQFGFFYNEDGFPSDDADETFEDDVKELYLQYEYILVTPDDDIFGVKSGKKQLIMEQAIDSYAIALEVLEDIE
jgi:hypothetical protein